MSNINPLYSVDELYDLTKKIAVLNKTVDQLQKKHVTLNSKLVSLMERVGVTVDVVEARKETEELVKFVGNLKVLQNKIELKTETLLEMNHQLIQRLGQETRLFQKQISEMSKRKIIDGDKILVLQQKNRELINSLTELRAEIKETRKELDGNREIKAQLYKKINKVLTQFDE